MSAPHRLLLVDDETDFIAALAERLELRGYGTLTADTGQQALDLLAHEAVDVVVIDMMMPGLSGLQTLERIRQTWPSLPVLLLSGNANQTDADEVLRHGKTAVLVKPVELKVLLEALHTLTT